MKFYGKRNIARKPVRRYRRKAVSKVSKGLRKAIKRIVKSDAETKSWINYNANIAINTASTSTPPSALNLLPPIQQGVGKSQRVGNQVTVKSAWVRGRINLLPYNVTTNPGPVPMLIRVMVVSNIASNSITAGAASTWNTFFEVNNGSANFQSNPLDLNLPINREVWRLHGTKTFKIGAATASSTGPVTTTGYYDNSPMSVPFSFNYGKHIRRLKFDDTTNVATNHNLFLVFQAVSADGTATTLTGAEYHSVFRVDYTDC